MNDVQKEQVKLVSELRTVKRQVLQDGGVERDRKNKLCKELHNLPDIKRGCEIDGCPDLHVARGYCMRHYCRIVRNGGTDAESPADLNPEAGERMTEDEFCRFKDFRSQGFSVRDIAFELQKNERVISDAWEHDTYTQYSNPARKTPWPDVSDL